MAELLLLDGPASSMEDWPVLASWQDSFILGPNNDELHCTLAGCHQGFQVDWVCDCALPTTCSTVQHCAAATVGVDAFSCALVSLWPRTHALMDTAPYCIVHGSYQLPCIVLLSAQVHDGHRQLCWGGGGVRGGVTRLTQTTVLNCGLNQGLQCCSVVETTWLLKGCLG